MRKAAEDAAAMAFSAGVTAVGTMESAMNTRLLSRLDIGVITEYLYDSRGDEIRQRKALQGKPFDLSPYQKDLVLGARLTLNDAQSTELLASVIIDMEGGGQSYNVEASRRIGNNWKLSLEARGLSDVPDDSVSASFRDDTRLRLELARYF